MTPFKKLFATAVFFFGDVPVVDAQAPSCDRGYAVFFANGMFTSTPQAEESLAYLRTLAATELPRSEFERIEWALAPNVSEDALYQFVQVLSQYTGADFEDIRAWLREPSLVPGTETLNLLVNVLPSDDFWQRAGFTAIEPNDGTVAHHLSLYRLAIAQRKKVIVVAHSQGNLYADLVYAQLTPEEREHVGIVHVASPAAGNLGVHSYLPITDQYYNFTTDWIIIAPARLNGNSPNYSQTKTPWETLSGHAFINDYLRDPVVGPLIVRDIGRQMDGLKGYCDEEPTRTATVTGVDVLTMRPSVETDRVCNAGDALGSPFIEGVFDYAFPPHARNDAGSTRSLQWTYSPGGNSTINFMTANTSVDRAENVTGEWLLGRINRGGYTTAAYRVEGDDQRGSVRFQLCKPTRYETYTTGLMGYDPMVDAITIRITYNEPNNPDNITVMSSLPIEENWPPPTN